MESLSNRRTGARRAEGSGTRLNPVRLLVSDTDADPTEFSGWLRHGIAAGLVAVLGVAVASSFLLTTTTDHTESSANPRLTANAPDITQAAPAGSQRNTDTSAGSSQEHQADTASGNLDTYDRRQQSSSRQAVRDQLAKVATEQQAKARAKGLTKSSDSARADAATQAQTQRKGEVADAAEAARLEQDRLVEEKRKAAEAARLAKVAAEKAKQELARRASIGGAGATNSNSNSNSKSKSNSGSSDAGGQQAPQIDSGYVPNGNAVAPLAFGTYRLSARWGAVGSWSRWHTGIDLGSPIGTPIRAAEAGVVISDSANGWAGNHVSIRHADGSATLYAHMSHTLVGPGTMVSAGTVIGAVGMTGRTFGPHLHFEYYPPGTTPGDVYAARDPWAWLYGKGVRL